MRGSLDGEYSFQVARQLIKVADRFPQMSDLGAGNVSASCPSIGLAFADYGTGPRGDVEGMQLRRGAEGEVDLDIEWKICWSLSRTCS